MTKSGFCWSPFLSLCHVLHLCDPSVAFEQNKDVVQTLLCLCVAHTKWGKWTGFHNNCFLYRVEKKGSSCLHKRREQKRSSGKTTPSPNCAPSGVIWSICDLEKGNRVPHISASAKTNSVLGYHSIEGHSLCVEWHAFRSHAVYIVCMKNVLYE